MEIEITQNGLQAEIIAKTPEDMYALARVLNIHEPEALLQIVSIESGTDGKNYKRIRIARVDRTIEGTVRQLKKERDELKKRVQELEEVK